MLVEYFEYDELKILKEVVLKEHELAKERRQVEKAQELQEGRPETHTSVKDLRDLDWDLCNLTEPLEQLGESGTILPLPPEDTHLPPNSTTTTDAATPYSYDLNHAFYPPHASTLDSSTTTTATTYSLDLHHPFHPPNIYNYQNNHYLQPNHHIPLPDYTYTSLPSLSSPSTPPPSPPIPTLPTDVLVEIFRYLSSPELCRCAQVCSTWNNAAFSPSLWSALYPVQWARGGC